MYERVICRLILLRAGHFRGNDTSLDLGNTGTGGNVPACGCFAFDYYFLDSDHRPEFAQKYLRDLLGRRCPTSGVLLASVHDVYPRITGEWVYIQRF